MLAYHLNGYLADNIVVGYLWLIKFNLLWSLDRCPSSVGSAHIWYALLAHVSQKTQIPVFLPGAMADSCHPLVWSYSGLWAGSFRFYGCGCAGRGHPLLLG